MGLSFVYTKRFFRTQLGDSQTLTTNHVSTWFFFSVTTRASGIIWLRIYFWLLLICRNHSVVGYSVLSRTKGKTIRRIAWFTCLSKWILLSFEATKHFYKSKLTRIAKKRIIYSISCPLSPNSHHSLGKLLSKGIYWSLENGENFFKRSHKHLILTKKGCWSEFRYLLILNRYHEQHRL